MTYTSKHLDEAQEIIRLIDHGPIEAAVETIVRVRDSGGRLFFLGVGGSAANCSHAVNDFRKIAGLECYAPSDNVSELTARTNDEGWDTVFSEWLKVSRLKKSDAIIIFSVGGGSVERQVSTNLVAAIKYAKTVEATIIGIVGRDGGYTAQVADVTILIPTVNPDTVTPHAEAFQAVIWHLIVSHPKLKLVETKWESVAQL